MSRTDEIRAEVHQLVKEYESFSTNFRYVRPTPAEREELDTMQTRIKALFDEWEQQPHAEWSGGGGMSVYTENAIVLTLAYTTAFSPLVLALLGASLLWMLLPLPIGAAVVAGLMWLWEY